MKAKTALALIGVVIFLFYGCGYFFLRATHQMVQSSGTASSTHTHFQFRAAAEKPLQCSLFYLYYPLGYLDKRLTGRGYQILDVSSPGGLKRTSIE